MFDTDAVLAANRRFYEAFADCDLDAMDALWARESGVLCIHPGWNPLRTREAIMESWADILANAGAPGIRTDNATAVVTGDMAFVVCHEHLQRAVLAATNIFVREGGVWRICHHHAAAVAHPVQRADSPEFLN